MSTNLKNSKWIQVPSIWTWQKNIKMNVSFPANEQNGMKSEARVFETIWSRYEKHCCPVLAALNMINMTTENQDCSRRSSDSLKGCVLLVKLIDVTNLKMETIVLAVNY